MSTDPEVGEIGDDNGDSEASFETVAELLDYPMLVVTTAANGLRAGCLVGFTTQVSISPAPILDGVAGWFSGRILDRLPLGDHVGMVLEPGAGRMLQSGRGVLTLSDVRDLHPGHEA